MATEEKTSTKDQVKALKGQGKSPQEIAQALDVTPATVYNHLRNLGFGQGKRGRPRKSDAEKAQAKSEKSDGAKSEVKTRPRPGSKSTTAEKASSNGHSAEGAARFPQIKAAVEIELRDARSRVSTLEEMLKTLA